MPVKAKAKAGPVLTDGAWPHYLQGMHPSTLETFEVLTWIRAKQYLHGVLTSVRLARAMPSSREAHLRGAHHFMGVFDGQLMVLYDLSGKKRLAPLVKAYNLAKAALREESK
jgi:hypothetical protein